MRASIAILLLLQMLVAQAGVYGMSCMHVTSQSSVGGVSAVHTHAQTASHASAEEQATDDGSDSHEPCCCAFVGHCSSSAVNDHSLDGPQYPPAAHFASRAVDAVARGFNRPPYRPPSLVT